jgi:predicted DCC family thiol-disulfide oxidoreductase YuxK
LDENREMESDPAIVLIEGDCALCNGVALWFTARDRRGALVFAPNSGEAARILGEPPGGDPDTVVVWEGSRRLVRASAIAVMLRRLGGGWGWVGRAVSVVPVCVADRVYDLVARRRVWLGKATACALLNPWHLAD